MAQLPFFHLLFIAFKMYSEISHENDISLEDQERRAFMNNSSIHSYNQTTKKDRIIRVTNGRIFRDGKVSFVIVASSKDRTRRLVDPEREDSRSPELLLQPCQFHGGVRR